MQSGETREEAVCRLHVRGVSASHIRDLTRIRYQRVVEIINYYETNHSVPPPTKRGRRSIITNDILTKITALTIANRFPHVSKFSNSSLTKESKIYQQRQSGVVVMSLITNLSRRKLDNISLMNKRITEKLLHILCLTTVSI